MWRHALQMTSGGGSTKSHKYGNRCAPSATKRKRLAWIVVAEADSSLSSSADDCRRRRLRLRFGTCRACVEAPSSTPALLSAAGT